MILAAVLVLASPPQLLKQVDIDKFNTPYTINLGTGNPQWDVHEWPGLNYKQCLFYRRATRVVVNANPNQTVLTFSIGNGQLTFSSPKQIYWTFLLTYFTADGTYVDLSRVKRFYLDCDRIPDIAEMYAYDKWFHSGVATWLLQPKGVYFEKSHLGTILDWKNIYSIEFRLDFGSSPNPLLVQYCRLYMTVEPGLGGPGSKLAPIDIRG